MISNEIIQLRNTLLFFIYILIVYRHFTSIREHKT